GRNVTFNQANVPAGAAGPGTIVAPTVITLPIQGPEFFNAFLLVTNIFFINPTEASQLPAQIWASFDGSTNEPIIYPSGTSIADLEKLLTGPFVISSSLPNGEVGVDYSAQLSGTGSQPPFTWSLAPGSALPSGLNISADGLISGTPSGPAA